MILEVWADTGEVVERPQTPEEAAQQAADEAAVAAAAAAAAAAQQERDQAALSGIHKLRDLGLTDDEIRALGVQIPAQP